MFRGTKELRDVVVEVTENLMIIPASSGVEEMVNLSTAQKERLIREINMLKREIDLVIVDTGSVDKTKEIAKKAGAIVTEEGGITSHAAIVSRELGIPSVIGTKIATKVLKDGDLVEVDANKGVVKILKNE